MPELSCRRGGDNFYNCRPPNAGRDHAFFRGAVCAAPEKSFAAGLISSRRSGPLIVSQNALFILFADRPPPGRAACPEETFPDAAQNGRSGHHFRCDAPRVHLRAEKNQAERVLI